MKDKIKETSGTVKFVYSFALMDIKERMYIGYGTSFKSEKEAFEKALTIAKRIGIEVSSLRLDRYYSAEAYVEICHAHWARQRCSLFQRAISPHWAWENGVK